MHVNARRMDHLPSNSPRPTIEVRITEPVELMTARYDFPKTRAAEYSRISRTERIRVEFFNDLYKGNFKLREDWQYLTG